MTQNVYYGVAGWLPYGATDDSILLKVDMTSLAEMEAISASATASVTADPSFDSELGMICSGSSNGWLITNLTGFADLNNEGQISIQVESSYFTSSLGDSTGDDTIVNNANDPTLMGIRDSGSNFGTIFAANNIAQGNVKALFINMDGGFPSGGTHIAQHDAARNSSTPATTPIYAHSYGKSRFTTINVGWRHGTAWLSVGGRLRSRTIYTIRNTGIFDRIYLGNLIGGSGYTMNDWYIRNLQISNRAPSFPVHPMLRRVITWSDSLFESTDTYATSSPYLSLDNTVNGSIRKVLADKGLYCGWLDSSINDGYTVYTGASKFSAVLSTITDARPDIPICQFGTNDVSAGASFDADLFLDTATHGYKALIDGMITGGAQKIIVCTVPPRNSSSAAIQAAILRANIAIKTLPAYNSNVSVSDVYTRLGGTGAPTTYFQSDGTHLEGPGMYEHGQEDALEILKVLG